MNPKVNFTNYIGEPKYPQLIREVNEENQELKMRYIGDDCDKLKGILKLRYPVQRGVFQRQEDILPVFNYIKAKLENQDDIFRERPILITEPILNPYQNRTKIAEALFDTLDVSAVFFASQPILSLYAAGNTSGVILESGEGVTQCCTVYEGYSIPRSYVRYDYGGRDVTEYLRTLLRRVGYAFTTTAEFETVKKIKENACYVTTSVNLDTSKMTEPQAHEYLLPDGTSIKFGDEKFIAPEIMFNPSLIGLEYLSVQEMIYSSICNVDMDLRKDLYQKILCAGGNTGFKGYKEKLYSTLKNLIPKQMKLRIHAPEASRCIMNWIGGNILISLEKFKPLWVTKSEWSEKGSRVIHTKTI
ncbi:MAG: hypothetical protein MJ252_10195 [archaeon]|nr:hypothetical protein [archaeon]